MGKKIGIFLLYNVVERVGGISLLFEELRGAFSGKLFGRRFWFTLW